jgi:crotonobetainyl-CoA:carnitine CoA-transferase CaiB-like acyl-CoA transferase
VNLAIRARSFTAASALSVWISVAREGLGVLMELVRTADVLMEGARPGVAERLGFGPAVCLTENQRLVYARMTGWGQQGPYAHQRCA